MHLSCPGGEITVSDMRMCVNHRVLNAGFLQAFQIDLRVKPGKENRVPCVNMHVHQIASVTGSVPLVHSCSPFAFISGICRGCQNKQGDAMQNGLCYVKNNLLI